MSLREDFRLVSEGSRGDQETADRPTGFHMPARRAEGPPAARYFIAHPDREMPFRLTTAVDVAAARRSTGWTRGPTPRGPRLEETLFAAIDHIIERLGLTEGAATE